MSEHCRARRTGRAIAYATRGAVASEQWRKQRVAGEYLRVQCLVRSRARRTPRTGAQVAIRL